MYLNTRLTQSATSIHTQLGQLSAHSTPATLSGSLREPRSNMGSTQVTIDIDSYPSRHAYGYTDHTDFAKQYGQQGFSDLASTTSAHTQQAWTNIENGGKPGSDPVMQKYKSDLQQEISKQRHIVAEHIPAPTITVHPAQVEGEPDTGHMALDIDASSFAETDFQPGSVDTEVTQPSEARHWLSEGHLDIRT